MSSRGKKFMIRGSILLRLQGVYYLSMVMYMGLSNKVLFTVDHVGWLHGHIFASTVP